MHKMQREMGRKKTLNMLRIKHVQNKFHNVLYLVQNTYLLYKIERVPNFLSLCQARRVNPSRHVRFHMHVYNLRTEQSKMPSLSLFLQFPFFNASQQQLAGTSAH